MMQVPKVRDILKPKTTPAEPIPDLPIVRANNDGIQRLYRLYAACQCLEELETKEETRVKAIPNGWRDLRLCISVLRKLSRNMKYTMPPEKRASIDRMAPRMCFRTWCGTEAIRTAPDEVVVASKELDVLMEYAWNECSTCLEQRCSQCKLGKTFDRVLDYDRDGGSWAAIDPNSMMRGESK